MCNILHIEEDYNIFNSIVHMLYGSYDSVKFEGKINSRQDTQGINRKGDDNDK